MIFKYQNTDIDSKEDFYEKIKEYYSEKNQEKFSLEYIEKLSSELATYFYNQYADFRKMYPKSIKRYSKLKMQDLENPITHDFVISFSKENISNKYVEFCSLLFGLNEKEFLDYEEKRNSFKNMF